MHIIISLKGPGTECVTLTTKCIVSAVVYVCICTTLLTLLMYTVANPKSPILR